ncbi:conserved domain protein [Bacteroides fluxus YIT 12057]|uniref:Conserved domain protein n=1 Tax=Bacteroides fluxus YIT 12057 TaxID=763034 RepID=F3PTW3_9BACE|nr:conserved domain protein [Bacteroides fluxus YIT 12057]
MSLFSYLSLRLLKWKSNNNLHIHHWQMYHLFYYISLILIYFQNKSPNSMLEPRLTTTINTIQRLFTFIFL